MTYQWFVVANRSRARVFSYDSTSGEFNLVKKFENPIGRVREREMRRHDIGTALSRSQTSARLYKMASHADPVSVAAERFAKKMAMYLTQHLEKYQTLSIVAEPHFLGLIRSELGKEVKSRVENWIKKDLEKVTEAQIADHLGLKKVPRKVRNPRNYKEA